MSIITPSDTALAYLQQFTPGQQRFDLSEQSDTTGHTATRLGGPPRWTVALRTLDALEPQISALWKAIAVQLRGRVNHLALHDVSQPQPRGTARGAILTATTVAAGAASASLKAATTNNLLQGGSFELDSNADGLADGWTAYQTGTFGTITRVVNAGPALPGSFGAKYQRVSSSGLNGRMGVYQLGIAVVPGATYTLQAEVGGSASITVEMTIQWYTSGGSFISESAASFASTLALRSVTGVAPSNAATARVYVLAYNTTGASVLVDMDNVQLEAGPAATSYGGYPTFLQGDWLQIGSGVGSHYCMVTSDVTGNDIGDITVAFEPPTRKVFAGDTAVTWDRPKCHFKQRPDSLSWSGAAGSSMVGGFAFDLMEDWSA